MLTKANRLFHFLVCITLISGALFNSAYGQDRAIYNFDGGSAASSDADPTTSAGDWVIGAFTGGDSTPAISSGSGTAFVRSRSTGDLAADGDELSEALANDAYFSFTLNTLGNSTDLSQLAFDHISNSSSSFSVALMSDLTGFTAGNEIFSSTLTSPSTLNHIVDLSSIGALQGLTSTAEFRFYFYDVLDNNGSIQRVDNVILSSTLPLVFTDWDLDGSGDWSAAVNWEGDAVPGVDANARFGAFIVTDDISVNVNVNSQLNSLTFNNTNSVTLEDGTGTITLTGDAEISAGSGQHFISANLAGTAGLTKSGSGEVYLNNANSFTGATDVQGGRLRTRNIDAIDNTLGGTINIGSDGELILQGDEASSGAGFAGTIVPDITGDGILTLSSSLTTEAVTLSSAKTFAGRVDINGGTLVVSNSGALGSGGTGDPTEATRTQINGGGGSGQLQLTGNVNIASETLDLNDRNDANTTAHLSNLSGTNTWGGNVNLDTGGGNYTIESQAGTLTISGNIVDVDDVLDETATLRLTGAGNGIITGAFEDNDGVARDAPVDPGFGINANIAVVKEGSGTWTIGTASTASSDYYQGDTTIVEGTLAVTAGAGNSGELASPVISVQSDATLDITSFSDYSLQVGQTLGGGGTVEANTVSYFADGSLTPGDSVGTLTINGALDMDGAGTGGALNFELSETTTAGSGVNDLIDVNGNVSIDGTGYTINVTPVGAGMASGTYTLIDADTLSGTSTGGDFTVNVVDSQGNSAGATRQSFAANVNTAADELQLVVSGAAQNKTWTGAISSNWDVDTSNNWTGGSDQRFFNLDSVSFPNVATTHDVVVNQTVLPASMTFSNTTNTYTVTGAAGIGGGSTLDLTGTGTVILANNGNSFTGDITIASGATLQLGDGSTGGLDTLAESNNINNSGTLNHNDVSGETLNGVITGTGSITNTTGTLVLGGNNTYTGATTVNGGTLRISNVDTGTPLGSAATGTTVNSGGALRANGQVGTVAEPVSLNGGTLVAGGGTNSNLDWSGSISVGASAGSTILVEGGTNTFDDSDNRLTNGLTVSGNVTGSSGQALTANAGGGSTLVFTGSISHNGALNVRGNGSVAIEGTGSIGANVTDIDVRNGATLDVTASASGQLALASGQSLTVGPTASVAFPANGGSLTVAPFTGFGSGTTPGSATGLNGTVSGDVVAASGSTVSGLGQISGNVVAQNGAVIRVGSNGISTGGASVTTSEDFESVAAGTVFTAGSSTGGLPGWTITDFGANTADATLEVIDTATDGRWVQSSGRTQVLAQTVDGIDFDDTGGNRGVYAIADAGSGIDSSNTVDIIEADLYWGDALGDGSGRFLDAKLVFGQVDANNSIELTLVKGQAGGTSTEVDLNVRTNNDRSVVFDTFSSGNFVNGFPNTDGSTNGVLHAKVIHDSSTGFVFFELSDGDNPSNVYATGTVTDPLLAKEGQIGFSVNNDLAAWDNLTVTTQAELAAEGLQVLGIDGDMTLNDTSILELDLASLTTFDQVDITGALAADGTLDVNLSGGFAPGSGDSFDILNFASVTGAFDSLDLPALGAGLSWDTSSLLVDGILSVIGGVDVDLDNDGDVDGADFLLIQRTNPSLIPDWQAQYGNSSLSAASTAVPEPTTGLLLLGGLMGLLGAKSRRK